MDFQCINKKNRKNEKWSGTVVDFKNHGTHYEIKIESRSSIQVIIGRTTKGAFACIPDFGAGCHLVNPRDLFWNTEQLVRVLGKVDGITVACALNALADKISL